MNFQKNLSQLIRAQGPLVTALLISMAPLANAGQPGPTKSRAKTEHIRIHSTMAPISVAIESANHASSALYAIAETGTRRKGVCALRDLVRLSIDTGNTWSKELAQAWTASPDSPAKISQLQASLRAAEASETKISQQMGVMGRVPLLSTCPDKALTHAEAAQLKATVQQLAKELRTARARANEIASLEKVDVNFEEFELHAAR